MGCLEDVAHVVPSLHSRLDEGFMPLREMLRVMVRARHLTHLTRAAFTCAAVEGHLE